MNHSTKETQLSVLRKHLDELDEHLVCLLAERFRVTDQIGMYKSMHQLTAADPSREQRQLERIRKLAAEYGLDAAVAERVLRTIMEEAVKRHHAIQVKFGEFL
ncbi:MAG: chorismate mutase [Verrucomicrobiae bacterium]|nr:chorismate mutase [Verrucomicrobiae bacterium]